MAIKSSVSGSHIRYLVITGYVLVVVIMIAGLFLVYNKLVSFSEKKIRGEDLSELLIVGNTLSKLYEIESVQGFFSKEGTEAYFEKYQTLLPEIKTNLDSLRSLSQDTLRTATLDTIGVLVEEKHENLEQIAELLDSLRKSPRIIRETQYTYVPNALNEQIRDYLNTKNLLPEEEAKSDTSVVYGRRRRLADRIRDVFVARSDSTVLVDKKTVISQEDFKLAIDTVVNMVRYSERLDLQNRKKFEYALLDRQSQMYLTNTMLTARIDQLLKGIEKEELEKSIRLLEEKDAAVSSSFKTVYGVSWLAILIALFFGILFLIDFNKSQRYKKQLERSNEHIRKLLASREELMLAVSHDIKAPMSSILGYIELMDSKRDSGNNQRELQNMKLSGRHILQLATNLLDFQKLESGTWVVKETNFNLFDLIDETTASFKPIADSKKLRFVPDIRLPKDLTCYGDAYVIRQIMGNIISNAIKYTQEGTVAVSAVISEEKGNRELLFKVKDTGAGIDKKDQAVIFEEFKQLDSDDPRHGRSEGSGLGLAITKRLVEMMDGKIGLESERGKGSEFFVILPLQPEQPDQPTEVPVPSPTHYSLEGVSVLLIDDDHIQLSMTAEMLRRKNMTVIAESRPENALAILQRQSFDILFVDIQMPQINGFKLAEQIRAQRAGKDVQTPIIGLSAKSGLSQKDLADSGFTDFLMKPFTSSQLYGIIHTYVKGGDATAIETETPQPPATKGAAALIDFVKDDPATSKEILGTFISETTAAIPRLESALKENNLSLAGELAHKMLPVFEMTGDKTLTSLLRKLENKDDLSSPEQRQVIDSIRGHIREAEKLTAKLNKDGGKKGDNTSR
mgnify:FL=1